MLNPIVTLAEAIQKNQPVVLVSVIESSGASPAKVGAQLVLFSDGTQAGTVGGGKLETSILADAQKSLEDRQPRQGHYRLAEEGADAIGTWCGGEVRVFIQPYFPPPQLVIAGGGHIGRPLKVMAEAAGFEVCVVDVEPGRADVPQMQAVNLSERSYVVLITTDHISDEAALRVALRSPAPYIGMIGSLAKCRIILDHLLADGFTPADLERVYAPIGLDLGCTSPQEIAVAIMGEVVGVRWKKISGSTPVKIRRLEQLPHPDAIEMEKVA
jgi:xanthine dehydrogenase accessory factor